MYKINFEQPIHIHFMGIGGISMSGFAKLLHTMGFIISGSDNSRSKITDHLESLGIHIAYQQVAKNITSDIDLVVFTAAISTENEEYKAAIAAQIPMMDRAEMVGQIMSNYKSAIAVSGTHGKTTTTSMLSHIFIAAQLDPTISVGGNLKAIDGNLKIGHSENFITEACEYTNSFLKFNPTTGIILNIEADHLDFFKDIDEIRQSFKKFTQRIPHDGLLVINGEIPHLQKITEGLTCKIITYGTNSSEFNCYADNIAYDKMGIDSFDYFENGNYIDRIQLNVAGLHNISNALAAIATARHYNIAMEHIKAGLLAFEGTDRRFQYKGSIQGITVIDDYAHHPTEIRATLSTAEKYPHNNIWCVFQPHTYSRTKSFLDDFAEALTLADKIILTDIYAAREKDPGDISSKDLQEKLIFLGKESYYIPSFDEIKQFLLKNCINGDLLITMGAGDVVQVGESLLTE